MGEKENFVATVSRITPEHRGLEAPEPMRELKGWLTWRYEQHPGEPKPRKIPYYADGGKRYGQQGSPNDRAKLTTFAAARDAAARRGHDGVGFALLADWGITALDFDKCVSPSGDIPRDIMEIVSQSYCEYSPSGEGIRAFIKGDLGNHKSAVTPDQYGFETFSSTGFCTFTNNMLPICEMLGFENHISLADDKVRALCERRFGTSSAKTHDPDDFMAGLEPRVGLSNEQVEELLNVLDPDMPRGPPRDARRRLRSLGPVVGARRQVHVRDGHADPVGQLHPAPRRGAEAGHYGVCAQDGERRQQPAGNRRGA